MDVEGRRGFWTAIREDAARGQTIIFATHYLEEADAYADRIVLIAKGQIVADGTAAQVKGLASGRTIRATWRLRPACSGSRRRRAASARRSCGWRCAVCCATGGPSCWRSSFRCCFSGASA
jgi:ABC-type multidrug transport system ATPase subunit